MEKKEKIIHHIEPYANKNKPIVDVGDPTLKLAYFNIVKLKKNKTYTYQLKDHESVIVLVQGKVDIDVEGEEFKGVGGRDSVWQGPADSVYVPKNASTKISAQSEQVELFIAGGKTKEKLKPFRVKPKETVKVQYGSDGTKTHRKILHILGQNVEGKVGNLLVSELFTVGKGGWSGFPPHKHDSHRPPKETHFEEIYQFRFRPKTGFAAQFLFKEKDFGPVYHVKDESTFLIDKGYHPVVVAPGYEMYYFTILVGKKGRSLVQYFHPDYADQVKTIPGLNKMIDAFK